jgi:hypothetical protein
VPGVGSGILGLIGKDIDNILAYSRLIIQITGVYHGDLGVKQPLGPNGFALPTPQLAEFKKVSRNIPDFRVVFNPLRLIMLRFLYLSRLSPLPNSQCCFSTDASSR